MECYLQVSLKMKQHEGILIHTGAEFLIRVIIIELMAFRINFENCITYFNLLHDSDFPSYFILFCLCEVNKIYKNSCQTNLADEQIVEFETLLKIYKTLQGINEGLKIQKLFKIKRV